MLAGIAVEPQVSFQPTPAFNPYLFLHPFPVEPGGISLAGNRKRQRAIQLNLDWTLMAGLKICPTGLFKVKVKTLHYGASPS